MKAAPMHPVATSRIGSRGTSVALVPAGLRAVMMGLRAMMMMMIEKAQAARASIVGLASCLGARQLASDPTKIATLTHTVAVWKKSKPMIEARRAEFHGCSAKCSTSTVDRSIVSASRNCS